MGGGVQSRSQRQPRNRLSGVAVYFVCFLRGNVVQTAPRLLDPLQTKNVPYGLKTEMVPLGDTKTNSGSKAPFRENLGPSGRLFSSPISSGERREMGR